MNDKLIPSRMKIDRAKKHLVDLEAVINAFDASDPYRLRCEYKLCDPSLLPPHVKDREVMMYHYKVVAVEQFPQDICLGFGDVVHNLRVALDLLAYDLITTHGGSKELTGFPFDEELGNLQKTLAKKQISVIPQQLKDLILTEIQPYKAGDCDDLWRMNKLDIIDKHRLLLATKDIAGFEADFVLNESVFSNNFFGNGDPDGNCLVTSQKPTFENEPVLSFQIVIAERDYFWQMPLVPTLNNLADKTLWVIERFEDVIFGAKGTP